MSSSKSTLVLSSGTKIPQGCRHLHTTEVVFFTDEGLTATIHQCDMCGVCVPCRAVSGESRIPIDERALALGYDRMFQRVVKGG